MDKKQTGGTRPVRTPASAETIKKNVTARARARALKRKKERQKKIILGCAACALVIGIIILIICLSSGNDDVTEALPSSQPTATQEPTPTPVPTPSATAQPIVYLPVVTTGTTSEKKICITVDDCFQPKNLETLMDLCVQYGAKITIFPIGSQVYKEASLQSALRRAYELGFEIENHTYSHSKLYAMTDEEMAADIYKQNMTVNYALGMEYEMHFLRMMGGNGEKDLRSHQYLVQLGGYRGIAHWGLSGSDNEVSRIMRFLEPGQIYLFHTTNADLKKLKEFIPMAIGQGYQLVTLNEMFGLEPNAVSPLKQNALDYPIPSPLPFVYTEEAYVDMSKIGRTQMYAVQLVQRRLQELGYLSENAVVDGDYGTTTETAITMFQRAAGLKDDGIAGKMTQGLLFSDSAPVNMGMPVEPVQTEKAE